MRWVSGLWKALKAWAAPTRRVAAVVEGDSPTSLPRLDLVLLTEGGEPWSAVMLCPCGCGQTVELPLLPQVKPRWSLEVDAQGLPTLRPSVWLMDGCRSHFFLRKGKVIWV